MVFSALNVNSSGQESLALAFEILKRIPKPHQITARELHQQLQDIDIERELGTIKRNLEVLCEYFDIVRDGRNKPYGNRWNKSSEGTALPKLSAQEAKHKLNPTGGSSKEREWLKK